MFSVEPLKAATHTGELVGMETSSQLVCNPGFQPVAYLGGALAPAPPPFQPTIIFYDGIFGCFTDFFLLKHQNLGIQ